MITILFCYVNANLSRSRFSASQRIELSPFPPTRVAVLTALVALIFGLGGCAAPETRDASRAPNPPLASQLAETRDLTVELIRVTSAGEAGSLVQDAGWNQYQLELTNRSPGPLTIVDVHLLTVEGRYVESTGSYEEITAPPDTADKVAGDVARRSAGIAAGQVIPYGGTIVGLVSGAISSMSAEEQARAKRTFALRRLKDVELAPGGRVSGSAFLPEIPNAEYLVVDYEIKGREERLKIPFSNAR